MRGCLYITPCSARIEHAGGRHEVLGVPADARQFAHAIVDGERLDYRYAWSASTLWLHTPGGDLAFDCLRREPARTTEVAGTAGSEVRATMNGRVVEVPVVQGASVATGDRLVVLEAMKMEHEVRALRAGRIALVGVAAGDQVAPGQVLVRYEGDSA